MIVQLPDSFFTIEDADQCLDQAYNVCQILKQGHYLLFHRRYLDELDKMVKMLPIPILKKIYTESSGRLFPKDRICSCLTTIPYEEFMKQGKVLLEKPSQILLENVANEWPLYERFVRAFQKDKTYGTIMGYLYEAIRENRLVGEHLGGIGELPKMLVFRNDGKYAEYKGVYRYKVCVIIDRDTSDNQSFNRSHNAVYRFLTGGKDASSLKEEDIYKLDFGEGYVWHQWYKRSIENYFPKKQYEELGMDVRVLPDDPLQYDYYHFEEGVFGYKKSMVQNLGKGLNKDYYEQSTRHFMVDNGSYNEILLVLLKIAKIV